jgi:UDP-glucose 4-epimerase
MAKVYGFEYVIFRPHNIYGPGQNMSDVSKNVIALFMRKLIEHQPYTLFGEGRMQRAFSYVEDVVEVMVEALDKLSNITMNVGSKEVVSIHELSDMIQQITGLSTDVELKPARDQEISAFLADHSLQDQIAHYKETPLTEGLLKTWQWVKQQELLPIIQREVEICLHQ